MLQNFGTLPRLVKLNPLVFLNHPLKLICLGFYIIVRNYNIIIIIINRTFHTYFLFILFFSVINVLFE